MVQNPYESPQEAANVIPVRPVGPGKEPRRPGDWLRYWGLRAAYISLAGMFVYCGVILVFESFLPYSRVMAMGVFGLLAMCLLAGLAFMFVGMALNVMGN